MDLYWLALMLILCSLLVFIVYAPELAFMAKKNTQTNRSFSIFNQILFRSLSLCLAYSNSKSFACFYRKFRLKWIGNAAAAFIF